MALLVRTAWPVQFITLVHVLQKKKKGLEHWLFFEVFNRKVYYNSTQPVRNSNQGEFGSNEFYVLSFLHRIKWDISVFPHEMPELLSFLVVYKHKVTKKWDLN